MPVGVRIDRKAVDAALRKTAANLADKRPLMENIGGMLVSQIIDCFDRAQGPDGKPWPPIKREGEPLKLHVGGLFSQIHYVADADQVEAGTDVEYAPYHQNGTRPYTIKPKAKRALFWSGAEHPVGLVHHPGLKPRPFVPRNEDELDLPEIQNTIQTYLEATLK
jgi:phage gpG-like protein